MALVRIPPGSGLKPEVKLGQAISEFVADLSTEQKARFNATRTQALASPPTIQDVRIITAEIGRLPNGRFLGTRFINLIEAVQRFAALGDILIGGSQNIIACGVWSMVRLSLLLITSSSSHLEKLSVLFMNAGRSTHIFEKLALVYTRSRDLQSAVCEYFTLVVRLCHDILKFTKMSSFRKFGAALSDSSLQKFSCELTSCAELIGREANALMHKRNEEEAEANSRFRDVSTRFFRSASSQRNHQQVLRARQRVLDFCCGYDYMVPWKQARKAGSTNLFLKCPHYEAWRDGTESKPLVYTGRLGAGKSVMLASMVDDLHLHAGSRNMTVAFFFARHDVAETLKARNAIGLLVRQLLSQVMDLRQACEVLEATSHKAPFEIMLDLLQSVLKPESKAFIVVDGLDELSRDERIEFLGDLYKLKSSFQLSVCLSFRQEPNTPLNIGPRSLFDAKIVSIPSNTAEIETFITEELERRVESRKLEIGDPLLPLEIRDALVKGSQGMFLWVALQIESLCTMHTDAEIRHALNNLPEDLSETFSRALQRANQSGSPYQKLILELITVAERQLTTGELREALSITPGDTTWNPSQLLNNIYSALACCGALVVLDEEELTLHFVHHSVKQHLTTGFNGRAENMLDLVEAHSRMLSIILTYLYCAELANQISKQVIPEVDASLAMNKIIGSTGHALDDSRTLALKLLRKKTPLNLNISKALADAWKARNTFACEKFLDNYAKTFWVSHLAASFPLSSQQLFTKAVATGSVEVVTYLIDVCNANVNWELDFEERTALHLSVMNNFSELTEVLLNSEDIDVLASDHENETPMTLAASTGFPLLYLAAKYGNIIIMTDLIQNSQNRTKNHSVTMWNTIERAVLEVRPEMVNLLLGFASDPYLEYGRKLSYEYVQIDHPEITKFLLRFHMLDLQAVYGHGSSQSNGSWKPGTMVGPNDAMLLHLAAQLGWTQVVRLAIAVPHLDLNSVGPYGLTPLLLATQFGQRDVVEVLIHEPKVDFRARDPHGNTALHLAAQYGHYDILVSLALNTKAYLGWEDIDGNAPLHLTTSAGQIDAAKLMVDPSSDTGLISIERKHIDVVKFLLGFDPTYEDSHKFHVAMEDDDSAKTQLLAEWKALIKAKDIRGRTMLHLTVLHGYKRATRALLEEGADPFAMNNDHDMPLHCAAESGNGEMVRILVQHPIVLQTPFIGDKLANYEGKALHRPITAGHDAVAKFLLSFKPSLSHIVVQAERG
ncbi:uncharacterized protein N7500_003692 [Penicillium coprophilum]|uniref:uncharacterized protein n=1 Tax=Penicillium coprophilum TaxID=36646 RepID=UPI00239C4E64|nr:uncharacterized protein N7500_003692 [Penicillium coprophilum]KAJ5170909.1 hypothetical protein N7500_003692 [Penicillium coprophilum]